MAFEQKQNEGAIFVNERKESDKHPDRTGTLNVGGVDYWINGWLNESTNGKKYMKLSVRRKDESQRTSGSAPPPPPPDEDFDDDIPF